MFWKAVITCLEVTNCSLGSGLSTVRSYAVIIKPASHILRQSRFCMTRDISLMRITGPSIYLMKIFFNVRPHVINVPWHICRQVVINHRFLLTRCAIIHQGTEGFAISPVPVEVVDGQLGDLVLDPAQKALFGSQLPSVFIVLILPHGHGNGVVQDKGPYHPQDQF